MPLNLGGECKTRLAVALSADARQQLVETMAAHVLQQLQSVAAIQHIAILSPFKPRFSHQNWIADEGKGLNVELARAAEMLGSEHILFVHADLPFVSADDISHLLRSAQSAGVAIAPDQYGDGTNALALVNAHGVVPLFGQDSQAAHRAAFAHAAIITCDGLGFDIDTLSDYKKAIARGLQITPSK